MALPEGLSTPAPKEKIPFIVKVAAEWVPVDEYLILRFQKGWDIEFCGEKNQIYRAADAIAYLVREPGKRPLDIIFDKIKFSADLGVMIARQILIGVPLSKYLVARHEFLESEKDSSAIKLQEFESLVGFEAEAGKVAIRKLNLETDLFLTEKAAEAAKISLS
ncbi:MAG: hypothetical protein NTZ93_01835 [Candidatus Beckwithbacteria bacterium]|nr:hypothetical protein [Candidatus Beckwithbacteria bacterium]